MALHFFMSDIFLGKQIPGPKRIGNMKALLTIFTALLCCLAMQTAWASPKGITIEPEEKTLLANGGVIVRTAASDAEDPYRVTAAVLIEARPGSVWQVMLDYENAHEFLPGVDKCRVLQRNDGFDIVEQTVDLFTLLPKITYVFRCDYQEGRRIDFKLVRGDLADLQCTVNLLPQSGGACTLLTYSIHLDSGLFVPQSMVKAVLQDDLPSLLNAIKKRVLSQKAAILAGSSYK